MIRAIVHQGFVGEAIEYFAVVVGPDVDRRFFFEQIVTPRGDVIRYFGGSSEIVLNQEGVRFRGNGGIFGEYMFGGRCGMIGSAMGTITLAHVSDLHLPFEPALSPLQRLSKRQLSSWAWRRRRALHRTEILEALTADLRVQGADHIVVTGDIANFSLPEEFRRAALWLAALAPEDRISLVPGNHDALVPVADSEGLGRLAAWTRAERGWPSVHRRDWLAIIGLNSARPTAPLLARGRIGGEQLSRLAGILAAEREAGRMRVVLLHHPVAEGAVGWRKALADRAELRHVLRREGAELVLHGHARDARFDALSGPQGPIPCLCVPSSTALPNPRDEGARWHRLTLSWTGGSRLAQVEVRRWSVASQSFESGGGYGLRLPRPARG